ncbi:hypothetical protein GCM10027193_04580 [Arenimonas aestuarii]
MPATRRRESRTTTLLRDLPRAARQRLLAGCVQRAALLIAASQLRDRGAIHDSRGDAHMDRRERRERAAFRCQGEYRSEGRGPPR